MKEYFVVADVHSFFTIMKDELKKEKKGFDEKQSKPYFNHMRRFL